MQGVEPGAVLAGTYVRISLVDVPEAAAGAVCDRISAYLLGRAPPLVALALHKHECKLSILNMTVKRLAGYREPVANKEELTIVTGVRTFSSRPVLSTNEYNADKFKLEKFMHLRNERLCPHFIPSSACSGRQEGEYSPRSPCLQCSYFPWVP
jgi:hypothetical protein